MPERVKRVFRRYIVSMLGIFNLLNSARHIIHIFSFEPIAVFHKALVVWGRAPCTHMTFSVSHTPRLTALLTQGTHTHIWPRAKFNGSACNAHDVKTKESGFLLKWKIIFQFYRNSKISVTVSSMPSHPVLPKGGGALRFAWRAVLFGFQMCGYHGARWLLPPSSTRKLHSMAIEHSANAPFATEFANHEWQSFIFARCFSILSSLADLCSLCVRARAIFVLRSHMPYFVPTFPLLSPIFSSSGTCACWPPLAKRDHINCETIRNAPECATNGKSKSIQQKATLCMCVCGNTMACTYQLKSAVSPLDSRFWTVRGSECSKSICCSRCRAATVSRAS